MKLMKNIILGVGVTNAKEEEVLEYVVESLAKKDEKYAIVTPNPEILVYAHKHESFRALLNQARIALCDGLGLFEAGKLLGKPFLERISGVDFMEALCKEVAASNLPAGKAGAAHAKKPVSVGFLGGREDVAERTANCLQKKYSGLKVSFAVEDLSDLKMLNSKLKTQNSKLQLKNQKSETNEIPKGTLVPDTDILFVALGFPNQEEWIAKHLSSLPVTVAMGVGGAFDYISGNVQRAPFWVRRIGLEWLFRLIRQPWRIKRQFALLEFAFFVLKERIANAKS